MGDGHPHFSLAAHSPLRLEHGYLRPQDLLLNKRSWLAFSDDASRLAPSRSRVCGSVRFDQPDELTNERHFGPGGGELRVNTSDLMQKFALRLGLDSAEGEQRLTIACVSPTDPSVSFRAAAVAPTKAGLLMELHESSRSVNA